MIKFTDSVKNIAFALAQFQGETINPPKRKTAEVPMKNGGRFTYKYADLADVVETIRPALSKYGLAFIQNQVESPKGTVAVYTQLLHKSGESMIFDPVTVPLDKPTAQGIGAALTYARRYSLCTALGIAADEDTDGQTEGKIQNRNSHQNKKTNRTVKPEPKAKTETIKSLESKYIQGGGTIEKLERWIGNKYNKTIDDLTEQEANEAITIVEQSIDERKQAKQGADTSNKMTSKQRETIFGKGKGKGLNQIQVKKLAYHYCQVDSMTKMTSEQADDLIKLITDPKMTKDELLKLSLQVEDIKLTHDDKQALIAGFERDVQNMQAMGANSY